MDDASLFCRLLIPILVLVIGAAASAADSLPRRDCPKKCGDVDIPYPFGIGDACSMDGFSLTCNGMLGRPFWSNVEILDISMPLGQIRMLSHISWQCYNVTNKSLDYSFWSMDMRDSPFRFSDVRNKFTVIGCDTLAYIVDNETNTYQRECSSMCKDKQSLVDDGTCTGRGCCQTTTIPKDLRYYEVRFASDHNNSGISSFSRCSYAVLLEADRFEFQTSDISPNQIWGDDDNGRVPVAVDWAIGNQTCEVAQGDLKSYACLSENSVCVDSSNGPGYLCNCSAGYQGNPYLKDKEGCNDIDECDPANPNPCSGGICQNLPGNYTCICPRGTHGEPFKGTCTPDLKLTVSVKVIIGATEP